MRKTPLVIIGLDSGDPGNILRWAKEGLLPTIASVLERGTHGRLAGPEMLSIHGVWTTFFSGVSLQDHGNYIPRPLYPETYRLKAVHPADLAAPPFWTDFVGQDQRVMIVDVPDSALIPGINGFQLANWGTHNNRLAPSSLPESLVSDLLKMSCPGMQTNESQGSRWRDKRVFRQIMQRVEKKGVLCRHLLNQSACDLGVVVFGDTHAASHRFRKYSNKGDELEACVRKVYQAVDREIGLLLKSFSSDTNVFIVSNCGINDGYPIGSLMDPFLRGLGYQKMLRPQSTLRLTLEEYLPSAWRSKIQGDRFGSEVDWEQTTAFAIPAYYTGYVRVNLKGREPNGTISPGSEYNSLLDRLEADFNQLMDEKDHEPVVNKINRIAALFGGGPPLRLPDLIINWRPRTRLARRLVHPKLVLTQKKRANPRGNYHSATGLILAAGPDIACRGDAGDFSPREFASLFRSLLNTSRLSATSPTLDAFIA